MQGTGEGTIKHTITPQKPMISHNNAENKDKNVSNTVKLTPKMKGIISQIRQNSFNRMRRRQQEEIQRDDYNNQVQEMLRTIKLNRKYNHTVTSTNYDLNTRISTKKLHIEAVVSQNQQKREKILSLLDLFEKQTSLRKNLQESLKKKQKENGNSMLLLKFVHSLEQNWKKTELEIDGLGKTTLEKQQQILNLSKDVYNMINQTSQTIQKIGQTHIGIGKGQQYQIKLSQALVQQSKRKIPNQQQMIKCMFLVGILSEQNFVLFLEKKQRTNQKALNQEKTNRFHKIYQSLCKRTTIINCKNSQIVYLRIVTSIYMHCKSLVLANLVTTMKTLSFFSQQFKTIYHYKQYVKYVKFLMQKMKFNAEWERMKSANQLAGKELPIHKRQLVVSAKQEYILFLQGILEIFLEDEYIVNLGNIKMKLRLETLCEAKNQCQKSQQASIFANSPCASQENRLHFEFEK